MKSNIDPERIRETYGRMDDGEILTFLKEEGLKLNGDAFLILKAEIRRRSIGRDILLAMEPEIVLKANIDKQRLADDLNDEWTLRKKIGDAINGARYGFIIMILGGILLFVSIEAAHFFYETIVFPLTGIIKIIVSVRKKGRYEKMLRNLEK